MIPLTHKPEPFDDDTEHTLICTVCSRLGKVVAVDGPAEPQSVTIWYAGASYTGGPYYSAAKTCDGNSDWLDK